MEYSGIEWNASAGYVPAALPLPCLTSAKLWISSGWAMRGRIQRRAAFLASFEAANCMQKNSRHFCSMLYCFIRGNTKESSAIQMCLLFFGWSFLMRSDLIGPAWLGNLMNLARPLTSGGHLCKGSNHSSALQISWWMDYAMDSLRHSAPHCEICWRHARNDIVIVLSSHPCRANNFKVLL